MVVAMILIKKRHLLLLLRLSGYESPFSLPVPQLAAFFYGPRGFLRPDIFNCCRTSLVI